MRRRGVKRMRMGRQGGPCPSEEIGRKRTVTRFLVRGRSNRNGYEHERVRIQASICSRASLRRVKKSNWMHGWIS